MRPRRRGAEAAELTLQAGRRGPQRVGALLHVQQQLFPRPDVLDDFIVDLGGEQREGERVAWRAAEGAGLARALAGSRWRLRGVLRRAAPALHPWDPVFGCRWGGRVGAKLNP